MIISEVAKVYEVRKDKIRFEGECIIWTGYVGYGGYAMTTRNSRTVRLSRYLWEKLKGPIPKGKYVLHTCDNPRCINIDHLWLGTNRDNVNDSVRKGRWPASKISREDVKELLRLYYVHGEGVCALARGFNVSSPSVTLIVQGKHYLDLFKEVMDELAGTERLARRLPTIHKW